MRSTTRLLLLCSLCACKTPSPARQEQTSERQATHELESSGDSLSVSGLRGTLTQEEIRRALEPKLPKFLRCASARLGELEVLSGTLSFQFHIAVNGSVAAVQPSQSTLGDRTTERCMLEVAAKTSFPAPHGGEADFTWPLELPLDGEVRAPVELTVEAAPPPSEREALQASCGGTQYVVTAYIDPQGSVLAAGVATPDPVTGPELDCVASGIAARTFASPGSYVGKLSFTVP